MAFEHLTTPPAAPGSALGDASVARQHHVHQLAGGRPIEAVRGGVVAWVGAHGSSDRANRLYEAWLRAGGDFGTIQEGAERWLHRNRSRPGATFLIKELVRQPALGIIAIRDVLVWCRTFPDDPDALWRCTRLVRHFGRHEVVDEAIRTVELLVDHLLTRPSPIPDVAKEQVTTVISALVTSPAASEGRRRLRVDHLLVRWLRDPRSFGRYSRLNPRIQRPALFRRLVSLLSDGMLDMDDDRPAIARFVDWVNQWQVDKRLQVDPVLAVAKDLFPSPVWEELHARPYKE